LLDCPALPPSYIQASPSMLAPIHISYIYIRCSRRHGWPTFILPTYTYAYRSIQINWAIWEFYRAMYKLNYSLIIFKIQLCP
jgi:hypothetical protein